MGQHHPLHLHNDVKRDISEAMIGMKSAASKRDEAARLRIEIVSLTSNMTVLRMKYDQAHKEFKASSEETAVHRNKVDR